MSLVKCTICGAVFDSDLTACPVCGQGPAFFVPVEPDARPAPSRDTDEHFLILGAGAAGLAAAGAIRERNRTARITLVDEEDILPYNRPMLTKAFDLEDAGLFVHPEDWYAESRLVCLRGKRVTALDAGAKRVTLEDGGALAYDACIYALGASPFVPPIPGLDLPEATAIRSTGDIRRILGVLERGVRDAVVIGGGVLGLEAAWTLSRLGCRVTVLEAGPRIMGRQLDEEAAGLLTEQARRAGITLYTAAQTERIEGDGGHVSAAVLSDGTRIPAGLVVVSIGVRANTAVAQAAGAAVRRGVVTDDRMRTSLAGVYACGDCAEPPGPGAQLWPVAAEMGRVAGANAAGEDIPYVAPPFAVTFHGMGTQLYAQGDVGLTPGMAYETRATLDAQAGTLEKCYYLDGTLCGVILLGDIQQAGAYAQRLAEAKA